MKGRIVLVLAVLVFAAGCAQYKTCATYAKKTVPVVKQDKRSV